MKTVIITRGLPASGKSTWAKKLVESNPDRWKRVNRDDLRIIYNDYVFTKLNEKLVLDIQEGAIRSILQNGFDLIIDNTHLTQKSLNAVYKILKSIGNILVMEKSFNVSIDECVRRNSLREGHSNIKKDVIYNMAKSAGIHKGNILKDNMVYIPPVGLEILPKVKNIKKSLAVLCDLDGTLAILNGRDAYNASTCENDSVNKAVLSIINAMWLQGIEIIFVSGRTDNFKEQTELFIKKHFDHDYKLFMRKTGDKRKDSVIKKEIYRNYIHNDYDVFFVLDDRPQVVRMWRNELGFTVFQLNDVEF